MCAKCNLIPNPVNPPPGATSLEGEVFLNYNMDDMETEITLDASGIPDPSPTGNGFHIHTGNDEMKMMTEGCGALQGHFNPLAVNHSGPDSDSRHIGDLGNVMVDNGGTVSWSRTDKVIRLSGDHNVMGRSFVLHAGTDDLGLGGNAGSLATGNAGARVACCIIKPTECPTTGISGAGSLKASLLSAVAVLTVFTLARIS